MFNMDSTDEPQKKIFKARKTMKVSDRQQLEAVYKVKEDSLNTTEVKLLNGKHENGDSDESLNDTNHMEDKPELNSMLDICLDPNIGKVCAEAVPDATLSDIMDNSRGTQDTELTSKVELLPTEEMIYEQEGTNNTASTEVGDQELDQNKDFHSNAGNGTKAEGLDPRGSKGSSLYGSERSCEKDFIDEQMDESGSVKTDLLSEQSVEETALRKQSEVVVVAEKQLVAAEPKKAVVKDQESVEEQPLQEPLHDGEEVAHDPQLVEKVVEPQQKELAEELQQNVVVPAEPQGDLVPTEEVAVVQETLIEETQLEGKVEEPKQQQLVEGQQPELGHLESPLGEAGLAQEPQMEAVLVEPRSEEEMIEDQLLEELAEEQQFGEELAEDNLLDELVEDQRPEDVLEKCEESQSLVEEAHKAGEEGRVEVAEEGGNKEKLEIQKTEDQSVVVEETPEVMVEEQDLEVVVVEKQEMKEQVTFELVVETQNEKDLKPKSEESQKLMEDKAEEMECNWDMEEKAEKIEKERKIFEDNLVEDAGEHAISSSMEIDQDSKAETTDLPEAAFPKPLVDHQDNGCGLENSDSMETEDIIPILEKLAPMEARLNSFSKPPVLSEVDPGPEVEDRVELSQGSSKQEHSENLPSEAFLVLSDEEDPCIEEVPEKEVQLKPSSPTGKAPAEVVEEELDTEKDEPNKEGTPPERSDTTRRKRSKSEDMDSMQSKRRRYEGEEYEAELQVKITTRADVEQKLQKVIQRLLEEKLCALQCTDFDKALADLKTRVEKIECTKHESVLSSIQAKIARLSKRFGAAREDMKKRQETRAMQPIQPSSPSKTAGDGANSSQVLRNVCTVRQMLDSKRNVSDAPATPSQAPSAGPPPLPVQQPPQPASSSKPLQRIAQMPSSQSPVAGATPARLMPDWKLIQQRINATHLTSPQPKPQTPVTATQAMAPVLSSPTTTAVVGTSQVAGSSVQPMSVSLQSLQSLPVILHMPVMQGTMQNATVMQSTTGTLITNQQSGNVEFIPSQNQANVGNLQKAPVSLASPIAPKPNNSPSLPSPMQRNSPASAAPSGPTLSVHGVSTAHAVSQAARTSLPTVSNSGQYTNSRTPMQMKAPSSSLTSPTSARPPAAPRAESQQNRTPTTEATVAKRAAESTTQSGKAGGASVIDLTLDEEDCSSSQDARKSNPTNISGMSQPVQIHPRPSQPPQTAPVQQNTMAAVMPSQTTIHVLPSAQTTVNVNHRPVTQAMPRLSTPRTPTSHQVVYSPLSSTPIQTPVRNTVMQGQGLRQVSPQTGGVTVRMPQTTAYVVNNGMPIGSGGPQLTVHHRPPQEPVRPIHPAPLPEAQQPQRLPPEAASTSPPQKPHLKLARVQSQNGIVLSWSVLEVDRSCASVDSYHLYAYHEDPTATTPSQWKKIGEVKALPLPMACTLTQFVSGSKYYFAVRAKDVYGRFGVFCDPQSTDVIATQNS